MNKIYAIHATRFFKYGYTSKQASDIVEMAKMLNTKSEVVIFSHGHPKLVYNDIQKQIQILQQNEQLTAEQQFEVAKMVCRDRKCLPLFNYFIFGKSVFFPWELN